MARYGRTQTPPPTRADWYRGDGRRNRQKRVPTSTGAKTVLAAVAALVAVLAVTAVMRHPSPSSGSSISQLNRLTTTTQPAPPLAQPATIQPPSSWKLVFNPNFSGSTLDTSTWDTCYWWEVGTGGCTNPGNDEQEWYLSSQVQVHDGILELTAKREATPGLSASDLPITYTCRSGMVTSAAGFSFKYGFVQIVSTIPFGSGLWPALWLHVDSEAVTPEIDIMEHWASDPYAKSYLHPLTGARQGGVVYTDADLGQSYHVFSLYWTPTRLSYFMDGHMVLTTTTDVPQEKMYFIMDLADTSAAAGTCNGTMRIKSVKVWQPPTAA